MASFGCSSAYSLSSASGLGELVHAFVELGAILGADRLCALLLVAPVRAHVGVVGRWQRVLPQPVEVAGLEQVDRGLQRGFRRAAARLGGVVLALAGRQQQRGEQRQQGVAQGGKAHDGFSRWRWEEVMEWRAQTRRGTVIAQGKGRDGAETRARRKISRYHKRKPRGHWASRGNPAEPEGKWPCLQSILVSRCWRDKYYLSVKA